MPNYPQRIRELVEAPNASYFKNPLSFTGELPRDERQEVLQCPRCRSQFVSWIDLQNIQPVDCPRCRYRAFTIGQTLVIESGESGLSETRLEYLRRNIAEANARRL
jgi:DNA-directed RNA polymerase subunit RPC12/RpoP